ncbi:hypothetical protein ATANTOWER_013949 [Ataeniobius toweri]|uniref:Secreted protein n=1 Tax=Ataeniobius toweri TaxID=208326 RepID=A0ABU7CJP4_9TELE|nr:hypothetical protein [Ataeniobius toweri]
MTPSLYFSPLPLFVSCWINLLCCLGSMSCSPFVLPEMELRERGRHVGQWARTQMYDGSVIFFFISPGSSSIFVSNLVLLQPHIQ